MKYIRKTKKDITSNFLNELLNDRGIIDINSSNDSYFYPTKDNEIEPTKLDHMEEGYQLLLKHLEAGSKIYLAVDCDVDGYTSAALFWLYFTSLSDYDFSIEYHIPEGKEHGLRSLMPILGNEKIADLIVLPDSSSNDFTEHKFLKELGYDILVLDHHEASKYSDNAIVINNQLSENYSNKNLSGVGVVYKFIEYFDFKQSEAAALEGQEWDNRADYYLDIVALGLVSDMMSMNTLENRYICERGLKNINNKFFKELVEKQAFSLGDGPLTQIGVAFYITPLINALIRVGNDIEKERLFLAFITPDIDVPSTKRGEKGQLETIATQSVRNCVNAKARQNREKEKAIDLLNIQIQENCLEDNKILILNADELNVSNTLTGLCAMGVAAEHKKPVMLGRISPDGHLKGSIRGREESELKDFKGFLNESGYLDFVEGHKNAAGFSLPLSNLDKLTEYANQKLENVNFNEGFYEADFIVKGNTSYLEEMIKDLDRGKELYGQGNDEPVMVIEDITINPKDIQVIGKNSDTMKFTFNGITYIKFKAKDLISEISNYSNKISICAAGKANMNYWGGRSVPQVLLDEIEIRETTEFDF